MTITRKARLEVWPQGATASVSQHNDEREALEAVLALPPGVHEIRVNGHIYLEVSNPDAQLTRVDIEGVPHIRIANLTLFANGKEQHIVAPLEWEGGSAELRFAGKVIGTL